MLSYSMAYEGDLQWNTFNQNSNPEKERVQNGDHSTLRSNIVSLSPLKPH